MNLFPIASGSAQRVCRAIDAAFPGAQKTVEDGPGFYAIVGDGSGQLSVETDLDMTGEGYRAALVEAVVVLIKAEAERRILSAWPDWRQRNALMDGGADLTACRAYIDTVRADSNAAEAGIEDMSIGELEAFDVSGW